MSEKPKLTAPGLATSSFGGIVTTGPVTVPLVLSLGIGIAAAAGKGENNLSGFGIVTLASLFPIIGVLGLGIFVRFTSDPQVIIEAATQALAVSEVATQAAWYETSPGLELVMGVRAIMPLVIFLVLVLKVLLRAPMHHAGVIAYGIGLAVLGMVIFSLGLSYGLSKLGEQSGGLVPAAFCVTRTRVAALPSPPLTDSVCSICTTASAPRGSGAPVVM